MSPASIRIVSLRCTDRVISLRASRLWDIVPGETESARLDVAALGLTPLALKDKGEWDLNDEYWGEEGKPIDAWATLIIACGPRRAYEMEQVVPGRDPDDFDSDPIYL